MPWRSRIVPREAGTGTSSTCCWPARAPSEPALIVPIQVARAVAAPNSNRKRANSSPILRSTSRTPLSRGRGPRGGAPPLPRGGGGRGGGRQRGRAGRAGRRDDPLGGGLRVHARVRLQVADL